VYLAFKTVDDRICISRIITTFHNLSFINLHAPIEDRMKQKSKPFITKRKRHVAYSPLVIISTTGDINAKIGREEIHRGLTRRQGLYLNTNNNGQRHVDFAAAKVWWNLQPATPIKKVTNNC
jgi:hypothetical protein